jgi:hypothetical protein
MPLIRRKETPFYQLLLPTHFTSVSMWVESLRLLPAIPVEHPTAILAAVIGKLILFPSGTPRQHSARRTHSRSGVRVCCLHLHQTVGVCRRSCRRGDTLARWLSVRALAHAVSMAAASFFACSASTSGFSFSLAGGFIVTPAFRGMT